MSPQPEPHRLQVILATDFGDQTPNENATQTPPDVAGDDDQAIPRRGSIDDKPDRAKTAAGKTPTSAIGDDEGARPATRSYTAPSAAVRQTVLAATGARGDLEEEDATPGSAGREAAEALAGAAGFVGQPGLSAPQPTVAGVVVSRPGLQEGPASGLGFASPFNILTPQTNPLSGVNGRCTDLISAGFFGGSRSACESNFRRR